MIHNYEIRENYDNFSFLMKPEQRYSYAIIMKTKYPATVSPLFEKRRKEIRFPVDLPRKYRTLYLTPYRAVVSLFKT